MPPRGRAPTIQERATYVQSFPNLRDFSITDEKNTSYNCVGWTVNQTTPHLLWPPSLPWFKDAYAAMDAFYGTRHMHQVMTGPPAGQQCVVALYSTVTELTHVALRDQVEADWWESKLGLDVRIMHRLDELEGGVYGNVVGYFVTEK